MTPDTIWYDGRRLERCEAIARVERDASVFLADRLGDFARDHLPWRLLVAELQVPLLDEISERTMVHDYDVQRGPADVVVVRLATEYPRWLSAIFDAARAQAWCVDAALETGRIVMHVRLDAARAARIEAAVRTTGRAIRETTRRGIDRFSAIIQPDSSPRIAAQLDAALRQIDRIEADKLASVERLTRGSP